MCKTRQKAVKQMHNITEQYCGEIETALKRYLPRTGDLQEILVESMTYSLLCGGKRIRPILVLEFTRLCGGDLQTAMSFACAAEMVHTYSLIHDDLPCMDNDDMRRGKPANHKAFGQDIALLAGDALQALAFETLLDDTVIVQAGADRVVCAAGILARAIGANGMVGGQVIDLLCQGKEVPLETLRKMERGKTGALITACAQMGCTLGGGTDMQMQAATEYADAVGLAFQIVDDILDIEGDATILGKRVGSDLVNCKSTYATILGIEQAKAAVLQLTQQAIAALDAFAGDTDYLKELARYLAERKQ